jgi:hypothetical protein
MSLGSYPRDWPADLSAREPDPFVRAPREGRRWPTHSRRPDS